MAGVAPNGNIWLLRGVPIDAAHTKTYRPKSAADQFTAFSAYKKYTLTEQTYIRHSINSIRVEYSADDVIDCNYMIFQNSAFSGKYFYAFITDVEYVSNNTCRIVFEIDNLQTYYFDIAFLPSFIDREHSKTDNIGDSITADYYIGQNIKTYNETIIEPIFNGDLFSKAKFYVVLATTKDFRNPNDEPPLLRLQSIDFTHRPAGYIWQIDYTVINAADMTTEQFSAFHTALTNYISNNGNGVDGIISMSLAPAWIFNGLSFTNGIAYNAAVFYQRVTAQYTPSVTDKIDGYIPRNNKLFTYPYSYYEVLSPSNEKLTIKTEYMHTNDSGEWEFEFNGTILNALPNVSVFPKNYISETDETYALYSSNYPIPAFSTTGFADWWSQNQGSAVAGVLTSLLGAAMAAPQNAVSTAIGGINSAITAVGSMYDMYNRRIMIGNTSQSMLQYTSPYNTHRIRQVTIDADSARQVDDYFTKYGYSVGKLKTPNFWNGNGRTKYNYCKTQEANIKSKSATTGVPMAALSDIVNIFNNGICLWETISDVGNYGDNPVRE